MHTHVCAVYWAHKPLFEYASLPTHVHARAHTHTNTHKDAGRKEGRKEGREGVRREREFTYERRQKRCAERREP
jgi:hypothetical protein